MIAFTLIVIVSDKQKERTSDNRHIKIAANLGVSKVTEPLKDLLSSNKGDLFDPISKKADRDLFKGIVCCTISPGYRFFEQTKIFFKVAVN